MSFYNAKRVLVVGAIILIIFGVIVALLPESLRTIGYIMFGVCFLAYTILDIWLWRCPHCDSYLWNTAAFWSRNCSQCGGDLYEEKQEWYSDYARLNYKQGELEVFQNGGSDMLLVSYEDGMLIHVGYDSTENEFVITVFANESDRAKECPLACHRIFGKNQLLTALQNTVHTWRDDKD